MINKYIFDYWLVLEEDPSFEKFVNVETVDNPENQGYDLDIVRHNNKPDSIGQEENDIINSVHDENDGQISGENAYMDNGRFYPNKPTREVELKHEYVNAPNPNYDTSILQLPPPNRFLLPGSKVWQGDYTFYEFSRAPNGNFICFIQKHRFSSKDHFIRFQKTTYRFDRKLNVTSEVKKHLCMFTYNTKTKQLYLIKKEKNNSLRKKSHFHNKTRNIFNKITHTNWNASAPIRISNKFLQEILKAAKKDVPDLVLINKEGLDNDGIKYKSNSHNITIPKITRNIMNDNNFQTMNLVGIILQHKVGKPMRWLNYELLQNMTNILSDKQFQELCFYGAYGFYSDSRPDREKQVCALRRKTIYKLVPNLKKNNHMSEAVKTIVGEYCNKFIIKLFNAQRIDIQFIQIWVYAAHKGLISKNLYHFVSNTINTYDTEEETIRLINTVSSMLGGITHKFCQAERDGGVFDKNKYYSVIDSYIKICRKLKDDYRREGYIFPTWHTWYDIYDMASQLNIRIRPNKFRNGSDIQFLHDKLSDIRRRDKVLIKKYENAIFNEFKSPDKKYDGFEFIQMRTASDLIEEGTIMKHCVASYADKCARGESIIFSIRKDGKHYITTELNPMNYQIVQQYTIYDYTVTNQKVLDIIGKWNKDCIELHKNDEESYYDMCHKIMQSKLKEDKEKGLEELIKAGIIESEKTALKNIPVCNHQTQHIERVSYVAAIQ